MDSYRAWAEIDLDALTHNLGQIRSRIGPATRILLVLKADAYGHGAVALAHHALHQGVAALGVGTSAEALELRQAGIRAPILVLGTIVEEEAADVIYHQVHIALHSASRASSLQKLAKRLQRKAYVHLNIDTGMGRLGVLPERAVSLLREVQAASHLELAGVMTHMAESAGATSTKTALQVARFERVLEQARANQLLRGWVHAANSACIFTGLPALYDAVRPGISAFGVLPAHLPGAKDLRPVLSLLTQIVFLKDLPAHSTVGYDGTWTAKRRTRVATLPIGYNDGVPWRLGHRDATGGGAGSSYVLVRGQRAPIIGRVSMDYVTIDVTDIPHTRVGERVTIIGRDGDEELRAETLAKAAGTIPYELTCSIGKRVERVFLGGEAAFVPELVHKPAPLLSS